MCDVFYKDGLYFECKTGCTDCCANEPGAVFLTEDDLSNISAQVKLSIEETKIVYTRKIMTENGKVYLALKEYSNNKCIFLKDYGCSIYKSRPVQCRTYPFWRRVLENKENWDNEALYCKGINSSLSKVSFNTIKAELESYENSLRNLICLDE